MQTPWSASVTVANPGEPVSLHKPSDSSVGAFLTHLELTNKSSVGARFRVFDGGHEVAAYFIQPVTTHSDALLSPLGGTPGVELTATFDGPAGMGVVYGSGYEK